MAPERLRERLWLQWLNNIGVALSLGSITAALLTPLFHKAHMPFFWDLSIVKFSLPSTALFAVAWMVALRSPKTVGNGSFRAGWLLSPVFAMLNAALACALGFWLDSSPVADLAFAGVSSVARFFYGLIAGATVGMIFWIPALIVTLLCFGIPIAKAQRLAKQGLAGEELGEEIIGFTSAVIAAVAGLITLLLAATRPEFALSKGPWQTLLASALAIAAGGVAGVIAAAKTLQRESARRAFVADEDAVKIPPLRLDLTPESKRRPFVPTLETKKISPSHEDVTPDGEALVRVEPEEIDHRVSDDDDDEDAVAQVSDDGDVVPAKTSAVK